MKMRKVISAFLVLICLFATFGLCTLDASAAEGARTVYATTNASAKQGSYGYLYVYLDDLTDLSALNVSVYYDTEKITVKSVTNRVSSVVNDLATGDGCVNASYIFDGKGAATKTNLFYIYYQVNNTAEIGDTYFDIVVNEAYNSSLEGMDFTGSRCSLEITEKAVTKSCSITSSSTVSTSVGEEFELSYRLSTYQIASGSMNIHYDSELFEVVSVTNGGFLTDKIADINTSLDGTIAISFVGTTYQSKYDVVKVRFKTLKNVTETSDIKLVVTDLYDKELNLYSCSGYTTKASIAFDESYTEDAPSMSVSSSYNSETGKVTATIKLEKDSMLGAGDFVLKFDTRYLTYISAEKDFSPTFFNINDKDSVDGILKFSIISLSDITDEQIILTVVFDVKHYCQDKTAKFEIGGSGLTDSLVNTIQLNFVDSSVIIPLKHTAATAVEENRVEPTCTVNGSYNSVIYCSECGTELSREVKTTPKLGHDHSTEWTVDVEPTCTTTGSKSHHCSRCDDKSDVTTIPANGHSYGDWYVITAPTCTATGTDEHECSVCHHKETKTTNALGHTKAEAVVENRVEPTCTMNGSYDSVVYCSVCNVELSREAKSIEKLGHNYESKWTTDIDPTCTTGGSKSHHCTRCDDKANITPIPANGHSYGDWYEIKAPTCTATGIDEHECAICHHKETKTTNALGHTESAAIVEKLVLPNCTTNGGYDSVIYCSVCNAELSRVAQTIEKLGHDYKSEWTTDLEPTCTVAGSKSRHCTRCSDKADITPIPANGHEYGDWYTTKEPTESQQGEKRRDCSNCDDYEISAIAVLDHSHDRWEVIILEAQNPTCTLSGLTQGSKCSKCGEILIAQNYIPANGHTYGDWYEIQAPTCIEPGTDEHKCSVCQHTETRTVDALGHTNSAAVVENKVDATCTVDGSYDSVIYCSVCEVELSRETKVDLKLGHNYSDEWTTDVEPACTTAGSKSHHCTRCDDRVDATTIPANGHSYGDWYEIQAPTCTETGTDEHECSVCQHTETRTVDALGHTNSAAVVEDKVDATCTVDGSYDSVIYCSVCKVELSRETKVDLKLGHNYSDEWTTDVEPACTTAGSKSHHCTRCDDRVDATTIPANGHSYGDWYEIKAPTCTATGTDEHKCSVCDHTETKTTNALGHTEGTSVVENRIESTCTTNGSYDSVVYCLVCGNELSRESKTIDLLNHNYSDEWTVDVEPNCTTTGSKSHHCLICDDIADVTTIPAEGHTYDDNSDVSCNNCGEIRDIETDESTEYETIESTESETTETIESETTETTESETTETTESETTEATESETTETTESEATEVTESETIETAEIETNGQMDNKPGCGGSISGYSIVFVALVGLGALQLTKKKKQD